MTADRKILVLDPHTVDQIAAGEVVERPSSVVKELVENAMDAGASAITVEIAEGGKKLIRVTDNGSGIAAEEVPVAFYPHATSKIQRVEDLAGIQTMGFRGEALSSIAAVSQVEVITRTPSALTGIRYCIEGGQETVREEIGAPEGTTFLVRNLFYNVPARSKFLKSATAEGADISSIMEQLALSHPEIAFKLILNSQVKLTTTGNGNGRDVIYHVYGREIARALLEISYENDFMRISGFAGKPDISRGNRSFENYYVNGRYVRNRILTKAIEDAYKGFLMQHKFPFASLQLEIDGQEVDVNVHPRKLELRFSREPEVYEAVREAVRRALTSRELIPVVAVGRQEKTREPEPEVRHGDAPQPFRMNRQQEGALQEDKALFTAEEGMTALSEEEESLFQGRLEQEGLREEALPRQEETSSGFGSSAAEARQSHSEETGATYNTVSVQEKGNPRETDALPVPGDDLGETDALPVPGDDLKETDALPVSEDDRIKTEASLPQGEMPQNMQVDKESEGGRPEEVLPGGFGVREDISGEQMEFFEERLLDPVSRTRHRLIGQLFDTYWLVEFGDQFYMIDQHAAHEKINYERLVRQFQEQKMDSQLLDPPMVVTLSLEEENQLRENEGLFTGFGFEIDDYSGREYCIRAVPSTLYGFKEEELFHELLDHLTSQLQKDPVGVFAHRLATMACKAAVKGGNRISAEEANTMIDALLKLDEPYHCPHGRPTIIAMTKAEIEKKFHRIV
ncbi:MAG: DNA mismatch repair endonuclease MutL [Blautia sp.]|nr:DNA mismatch repair endonuclease MutL [Blautia sp.]